MGFGVDTVGAVQVIDAKGEQAWIATGHFVSGGLDHHAEARALEGLKALGPNRLEGSRIMVVVDQIVCDSCRNKLHTYAEKVGAKSIEIYHPRLENERTIVGSGVMKSPKSSSSGSFRGPRDPTNPRPPLMVRLEETIEVRPPPRGRMEGENSLRAPALADTEIRTAVKGAIAGLAAGVALGIFQGSFKDYMVGELARMPTPKAGDAKEFFTNRATGKAMRVIDLLNKHLEPFGTELAEQHMKIVWSGNFELGVLRVSTIPDDETLAFLDGLQDELDAYDENLKIVEQNLETAQKISPRALEAAQAAEDLAKYAGNGLVFDGLVKQGFSALEVSDMHSNLATYAARVRRTYQHVDSLRAQVTRQRHELATLASSVNLLYWTTILAQIARGQQPSLLSRRKLQVSLPSTARTSGSDASSSPAGQDKTPPENKPKSVPVGPLR